MADQNSALGNASDFSILAERLMVKNSGKQTDKLNKNLEGLNKSILSLAKSVLPNSGLGQSISEISASRRSYNTFGENLKSRVFGGRQRSVKNKFGTLRGALDTFGIVNKGSGSLFDQALERRESKNQFIDDQLKVNPQMVNTKENRETFGKKFDTQQKLQKELNAIHGEIERLREGGFTDKQISRSGLFKKQDASAAKLAASDNRLYGKIKDEMAEEIKKGLMEGFMAAAKEAQAELKRMDKTKGAIDPTNIFGLSGNKSGTGSEELLNEQELIQEGILKVQEEIAEHAKAIREALEDEPDEIVEKKESIFGGWLKTLLGTISGFLIAKMTGIVGMMTTGISAMLSPLLKVLGIGKATSTAGSIAGGAAAAGGAVAAKGGIVDKVKGIIKFAAPKIGTAAKIVGGLLLSKPALIAAAVAGTASIGYSMLSDDMKDKIDTKVAKILGNEESETKIAKSIKDEQIKIEKVNSNRMGDIVNQKSQEVNDLKNRPPETATIINSPTTNNNNSNSVVNNHIKSSPRNSEVTFNKFIRNRYSVA